MILRIIVSLLLLLCFSILPPGLTAQKSTDPNAFLETLQAAKSKTAAKDWAGAADLWSNLVKANPVEGRMWNQLGNAYYHMKDYPRAIEAYKRVLELGGSSPATAFNTNNAAVLTFEKTAELRASSPMSASYNIACSYALLGEKEQALTWLKQSIDLGYPDLIQIQKDTDLTILHDDNRFKDLVGLTDTSKMSRVEGWRFDLQFLRREVWRKAFGTFSKTYALPFEAAYKKLYDTIPNLTDAQIQVEMAKLMNLVGDGHSALYAGISPMALPLQFYLFEEGLFVIAADPKYKELLGAQVLKFGDKTVDQIVAAVDPVIPRDADNPIWVKQVAPYRMRSLPLLNTMGLIPSPKNVSLTIRGMDGREKVVKLDADSTAPNIWNVLPHPASWVDLPQTLGSPVPLYLKNMQTNYWFEYLPTSKTVYFQFTLIRNDKQESLAAFSERLHKFIQENSAERLIIDIRWNNGGNASLLAPLISDLITDARINKPGKLFVIIGRRVFSAGQTAAALLERYTNAIFVGEPTGSSPNFVGEEDEVKLPYSKIGMNVSDLYWENSYPQDRRRWIAPQIYLPPTFEAFRANRDTAMEAIAAIR